MQKDFVAIVLCAGKDVSVDTQAHHKVCSEINGKPAILHAMERYKEAGISRFVLVVSDQAESVMETVSIKHPNVCYAYQPKALGTGNAVKCAFNLIRNMEEVGGILVTMGDVIVAPHVVQEMLDVYQQGVGIVFAAVKKENNPGGGLILSDQGHLLGIAEWVDVQNALFYQALINHILDGPKVPFFTLAKTLVKEFFQNESLQKKALNHMKIVFEAAAMEEWSYVLDLLQKKATVFTGGQRVPPLQVMGAPYANAGVCLLSPLALDYGLSHMDKKNIREEFYFTEAIVQACNSDLYKTEMMDFSDDKDIIYFDNPEQLHKAQEKLEIHPQNILSRSTFKKVSEWLFIFEKSTVAVQQVLRRIYGETAYLPELRETYIQVLTCFREKFGNKEVVISRAPGRVNLMGRHVDTQGGKNNVVFINREVIAVAAKNEDVVRMTNTDSRYPDRMFDFSRHSQKHMTRDKQFASIKSESGNGVHEDWSRYVRASLTRLQRKFKDQNLCGMDIAFSGNVPVSAGLSGSSAYALATAEAAVNLNELNITTSSFVDVCGEGEWFLGAKGDARDHTVMKHGKKDHVATFSFFPFAFEKTVPFPKGYRLMLVNVQVGDDKKINEEEIFNERMASYELGLMLLKDKYLQYADQMKMLRDINPDTLGISQGKIYEMILSLPEQMTPEKIFKTMPKKLHAKVKQIMRNHTTPDAYPLRSMMLYGVSECLRAERCSTLLAQMDMAAFGELMWHSHDGERVARLTKKGLLKPYRADCSDEKIKQLIQDVESKNKGKAQKAEIIYQGGGYAGATPEIDFIVDTVRDMPGVVGAQLSGTGQGGCVMVLAQESAIDAVKLRIEEAYFTPRNLSPDIIVCNPVEGAQVLSVQDEA